MDKEIPIINLDSVQPKKFGFRIGFNREILLRNDLDHDPFRPHRIRFYSVLFILEGEGVHYIDFKKYRYKPGSIIFISKEQVHAFEYNLYRRAYFLLFTEEFLERGNPTSSLMQQLSLYNYHLFPPVIHLKREEIARFASLANEMKKEFDAPDDQLTEEILHASLKIFLCQAERIRKINRADKVGQSKYHEEFAQFQKLLSQEVLQSKKVQYYADALFMSTKKLNRITQEVLGKGAKSYIDEVLIIEIKRLLMNTSYTIKEIAYASGFEETTNFVKFFRKHTEMNPGEFRKQYAKQILE